MTKKGDDRLRFVRRVTQRHGEIFREGMRAQTWSNCDDLSSAFGASGIIEWRDDHQKAELRFIALEEEILNRTFVEAEDEIVEAFVRVARGHRT